MVWIRILFISEAFLIFMLIGTKRVYISDAERDDNHNATVVKYNSFLVFLVAFLMILVSALRNSFIDTVDYRLMYNYIGKNIENVFNNSLQGVEKGYLLFTYGLNHISGNSQFLLIVTTVIIIAITTIFIKRESVDVPFSLWMFFCLDFINTMNGVRQVMAGAFAAILWERLSSRPHSIKNDIMFIFGILILSTIHRSVLICIPIMLLCRGRIMNMATRVIIFGTIAMLMVPGIYYFVLEGVLAGTDYEKYITESATMGIARLIVNSVPVVMLAYSRIKGIRLEEENEKTQWMLNLCIFNFCCSVLSLRMVFFARIGMFFKYFDFVMLPYLINRIFDKKSKSIKLLAYILYGIYFFVQLSAFGGYIAGFDLVI